MILLTGATGYVGGRLLRALEAKGLAVRCLVRRPEFAHPRESQRTEVVQGDVLDLESLRCALTNVDVAYYLVHSMGSTGSFEAQERQGAESFAAAARECGVRRIVYLGGLGSGDALSPHLQSRQNVGAVLRKSGVQTIEFRASIIIGSGSLSFEIVRALVSKLPIMITPSWVRSLAQPIAVEDVIAYLMEALAFDAQDHRIYEIGGPDQVSYSGIMQEYARQRGLKRLIVPVPVLTPGLSSLWLRLITPVYAQTGRKLIDSIRNDTVVQDNQANMDFEVKPRGIAASIARAIENEDREFAETRWSDALSAQGTARSWGGVRFGSRLVDSRSVQTSVSPSAAFQPIASIGGERGWYYGNWLWRLRGMADLIFGGPGLRRGRRDPLHVRAGDTIDFWRVEEFIPDRLLRLHAEMKVPGRAWLQFEITEQSHGSAIRQTAIFDPVGILGLMYWYALYPVHQLVFGGMLKAIGDAAEQAGNQT